MKTPEKPSAPKTRLTCPCGETLHGADQDDLVEKVRAHLRAQHPDLDYTREQILFVAEEVRVPP